MARPEKVAAVAEVRERIEAAGATFLTEYRGLTVAELADLRAKLREVGAEYKVVKNTLTSRAVAEVGVDVPARVLTGPTALTYTGEDPVAAAKVLKAFIKDHPNLVVKAGVMDGAVLDDAETMQLAELASRDDLLAKLAGMFGTIMASPARLAQAKLAEAARILGALQAKRAEEGDAEAA